MNEVYAFAVGILVGTVLTMLYCLAKMGLSVPCPKRPKKRKQP